MDTLEPSDDELLKLVKGETNLSISHLDYFVMDYGIKSGTTPVPALWIYYLYYKWFSKDKCKHKKLKYRVFSLLIKNSINVIYKRRYMYCLVDAASIGGWNEETKEKYKKYKFEKRKWFKITKEKQEKQRQIRRAEARTKSEE